ncbi:hypothetical protein CBR_g23198 [Chara braunii]|uniref:Reverse transcriptase/retrotransposon-derived protein RNase H-like domain-containing protein n=1 Tax=Chara braunii TaxID=69332 RepID=A0A388JVD9_CHABU|nr:hypothetical protein CBR_g23198 [Chara braunii]|eukprot:GBG61682.1 hypothetical protein CBR_g23198 [Chara braunii]
MNHDCPLKSRENASRASNARRPASREGRSSGTSISSCQPCMTSSADPEVCSNWPGVAEGLVTGGSSETEKCRMIIKGSVDSVGSSNRTQALRRKIKKVKQRLAARKHEFQEVCPAGAEGPGVTSAVKLKLVRWYQELHRVHTNGGKAGAGGGSGFSGLSAMEPILQDVIKFLDGKEAELHTPRPIGYLDLITLVIPNAVQNGHPGRVVLLLLRLLCMLLTIPANCSYAICRNLLPPLIPMLSTILASYSSRSNGTNSPGLASDSIGGNDCEEAALERLLWVVAAVVKHACVDERQLLMQDDLVELLVLCEVVQRLRDLFALFDPAATSACKKEDEEAEEQCRLTEQQRQEDVEAARKAADKRRQLRRDKILECEGDIEVIADKWEVVADEEGAPPVVRGLATTIEHVSDLVATCAAQQKDILCVDTLVQKQARLIDELLDRVRRLEQQPTTANPVGPSNLTDRVNVLEIDVETLKDGALATNQRIDQQICAATASPTTTTRESIPKFDGLPIFCDAARTDLIPWWRQFELKLDIHHVSNPNRHAYLYSRSGGACQAWLDNMLSTYTVAVFELHTKISWADLKAAWHKRFQVEPPELQATEKLQRFYQNDLRSMDWITEYQRLASTPNLPSTFVAIKHFFIRRSCPALQNALTEVAETLTTSEKRFDKASQIIVTNAEAKNLGRSSAASQGRDQHRSKVATLQTRLPLLMKETDWQPPGMVADPPEGEDAANRRHTPIHPLGPDQRLKSLGHITVSRKACTASILTGYYQRFIKGYSKIAAHLAKIQCEDRPFDFGEDARESFLALKATLLSAEVLRIYNPLLPRRVTMDASGYGIGVVLEQHDGVDEHPVEYFSKKVPVVHSIDDARKKEILAFVHTLKRWRHFLLGRSQFRWVKDNNLLVFYKTEDAVNSTIARWMAFIDQFDFFPDHIPGKSNGFVDALSQRPDHCTAVYSTFEIGDDLRNSFIRCYQADPEFRDNQQSPLTSEDLEIRQAKELQDALQRQLDEAAERRRRAILRKARLGSRVQELGRLEGLDEAALDPAVRVLRSALLSLAEVQNVQQELLTELVAGQKQILAELRAPCTVVEGAPIPSPVLLGLQLLEALFGPRGKLLAAAHEAPVHAIKPFLGTICKASQISESEGIQAAAESEKSPLSPSMLRIETGPKDRQSRDVECMSKTFKQRPCKGGYDAQEVVDVREGKDRDSERDVGSNDELSGNLEANVEPTQKDSVDTVDLGRGNNGRAKCADSGAGNPLPGESKKQSNGADELEPGARGISALLRVTVETGLVGLPSLLTAVLLHAAPVRSTSEQV